MSKEKDEFELTDLMPKKIPESGCKGFISWAGSDLTHDYDCGYNTTLECDECKYGDGRKDPAAKCNQIKD